jgi:hypothetical protein
MRGEVQPLLHLQVLLVLLLLMVVVVMQHHSQMQVVSLQHPRGTSPPQAVLWLLQHEAPSAVYCCAADLGETGQHTPAQQCLGLNQAAAATPAPSLTLQPGTMLPQ